MVVLQMRFRRSVFGFGVLASALLTSAVGFQRAQSEPDCAATFRAVTAD